MQQAVSSTTTSTWLGRIYKLLAFLIFLVILAIGLWARVESAPILGFQSDQDELLRWADFADQQGLFKIYLRDDINHPPLSVLPLVVTTQIFHAGGGDLTQGGTPQYVALKAGPIIFDLILTVAAYAIMLHMAGPFWALIPAAAIALNPFVITDSAIWGQTDIFFTIFLVLSIGAMSARHLKRSWAWYSLALLSRLQSLPLSVLMVVSTIVPAARPAETPVPWYGTLQTWKRLGIGIGVSALVTIVVMLPFFFGSGEAALHPVTQSVDLCPTITVYAYNLWWLQTNGQGGGDCSAPDPTKDAQILQGTPFSYKTAGLLLLSAFVLLVVYKTVTTPYGRNLFLLAGMLYVAFFMLPTQIHERYIYPAIPLLAMSTVSLNKKGRPYLDWRGVILCAGFTMSGLFNVYRFMTPSEVNWIVSFVFAGGDIGVATFNVLLVVFCVIILLWPSRFKMPAYSRPRPIMLKAESHG